MNRGSSSPSVEPPSNQRMKLTGAAILVSRGMKVLQAAPAAYPYRSACVSRGILSKGMGVMRHQMPVILAVAFWSGGSILGFAPFLSAQTQEVQESGTGRL